MQCEENEHEETSQGAAVTTEDNQSRRECAGEKQRPSLSNDPRRWSPGNHEGSYE
jgi:hypothetical protein